MNKSVVLSVLGSLTVSFSLWATEPAARSLLATVVSTPIVSHSATAMHVGAVTTQANSDSLANALPSGDSQIDVEAVMKTMALHYKQAAKSQTSAAMSAEVSLFQQALVKAKAASYPADKAAKFQQGFQEIEQSVVATQAALHLDDLAKAKQHWQQIDHARKTYHKLRSPSIWDLLFGGA